MKTIYFTYRLDSVELRSIDANMAVSTQFNRWEINEEITLKLSKIKFEPDLNSLNYRIMENQLFVEGMAYEQQEPPDLAFEII